MIGPIVVIAGTFGIALAQWLLFLFIARAATNDPAAAVGLYALLLALATPIFTFFQFGLRNLYVTNKDTVAWKSYWKLRVPGLFAAIVIFWFVSWRIEAVTIAFVLAVTLVKCADGVFDLFLAPLQKNDDLTTVGGLMIVNAVGTIILAVSLIEATNAPVVGVVASGGVSAATAFIARSKTSTLVFETRQANPDEWKRLVRPGVSLGLGQVIIAILAYVPVILLTIWSDVRTIGVYSIASYIVTGGSILGASLQLALLPRFLKKREREGIPQTGRFAIRLSAGIGLVGVMTGALVLVVANGAFERLYGNQFRLGFAPLVLLCLSAVGIVVSHVMGALVLVRNRYSVEAAVMGLAAIVTTLFGAALLVRGADPLLSASSAVFVGMLVRTVGLSIGGFSA